ncbi:hypothetical protein [Enemella sp. A6]|uniref:hypothetical protein n=1 Tax=Enemella sp. A6 TaxID=3440152 RepID=UPI003EBDA741
MSDSLVVLVAPPGPADGVVETLVDWSAAGLVAPFAVVDPSSMGSGMIAATVVDNGHRTGMGLDDVVTVRRWRRVRLCVLVPVLGEAPAASSRIEHAVHEVVLRTGAVPQVELLRCLITRPASGTGRGEFAREGWHNLLIAPEESRGPGRGQTLLDPATDPVTIGPDAAAAIAGVTGLWSGLSEAPLDGVTPDPGRTIRLVRSFHRRLDAREVADRVRQEVINTGEVPRPRLHGTEAVYIDDAAMATHDMAMAVLRKHAPLFRGQRVQPAATPAEKVGIGRALSMLFSFIWASITLAPMKWYSMVVGNVSAAAARGAQALVFGSDPSAFNVVAKGELASGDADWQDIARASADLENALEGGGPRRHESSGDFSPVWRDYVEVGLTLIDAGDRSHALPPVQVGTDRGVLRHPGLVAPSPDDAFTAIPPRVSNAVKITTVRAGDPLGTHTLQQRLLALSNQPSLAREVDQTLRDLADWQQRHNNSYAARTGALLGKQLMDTSNEVRTLMSKASQAAPVDLDTGTAERQKSIAAWMRAVLIVFLVSVAALILGGARDWLNWLPAGIGIAINLVLWAVTSMVLFMLSQRELFRDLHRRKVAVSQAEADRENLRIATRDLRRQTEAYGQLQEWTRVLGVVVHEPFGRSGGRDAGVAALESGLPLNAQVGFAVPEPRATGEVVAHLRRTVFVPGWLSAPWERALADAGARLGPQAFDLSEDPRRMFGQRAGVSESWLTRWSALLERDGAGEAAAEELWRRVLDELSHGSSDLRGRLISDVRVIGQRDPVPVADFLGGLGDEADQTRRFDERVLSREARLADRARVATRWPRSVADGLSSAVVLTELSAGIAEYDIDLTGVATAPASSATTDWAEPAPVASESSVPAPGTDRTNPPPQMPGGSGMVF